jgi:hypothetical protein
MIVNRIGSFFMLLGGFLIFLFIISLQASRGGNAALFLWGLASFFLGAFLWWRSPKQSAQPSNRFRMLRREKKAPRKGKNRPGRDRPDQEGRQSSQNP